MNQPKHTYIAIDIAKADLEVLAAGKRVKAANTPAGFRQILGIARDLEAPLVVFEASGGYERALMEHLSGQNVPVAMISPARLRAFAGSEGVKAKTDPIDARMILRFAQEKKLAPMRIIEGKRRELADLMDRRSHLSEQLTREKTRLQKAPELLHASIRRMIHHVEKEISLIEKQIEELIAADEAMSEEAECIQSIKGMGKVNAWTLMGYLGEIHHLKRNQLVALAGLAPFNRDTGKSSKNRFISGGRAKVRKTLYMAATCAAVHNPVIKAYVQKLRQRGKPYKCAIVAAMRKLLLHVQSLLKNQPLPA
ncbi:MAG: IS110 family transposase [Verrucomicrobia bacterium]|jgi:transposase|nr:IS110 family transposase [Verrucomicrobiota bacterium]